MRCVTVTVSCSPNLSNIVSLLYFVQFYYDDDDDDDYYYYYTSISIAPSHVQDITKVHIVDSSY